MFDHLVTTGVPAGPFAIPVPMYRVGSGKLHARPNCRSNAELVNVILWTTPHRQLCERCVDQDTLPHKDAWRDRNHLSREAARLVTTSTTTDLSVDATYLSYALWSKLDMLVGLRDVIDSEAWLTHVAPRLDDELEQWRQSVYLPSARAALGVLVDEFTQFGKPTWPLRFAAITPFGFGPLPTHHVAGPTPSKRLRPFSADHQLVAELRNGLLYRWFTADDVPGHAELAAAALAAVTQPWRSTYTPASAASDLASTLLKSYDAATAIGEVVYEWTLPPKSQHVARELPRGLLALLSTSRVRHPLKDGAIVIASRAVIDALPHLESPTWNHHVLPSTGAIYGPATTDETNAIVLAAAALQRGGMPHREALEMARLAGETTHEG
jgi:hypothetical protein